eukprot:15467774-Alexandrium_andersonii.AAC.1
MAEARSLSSFCRAAAVEPPLPPPPSLTASRSAARAGSRGANEPTAAAKVSRTVEGGGRDAARPSPN